MLRFKLMLLVFHFTLVCTFCATIAEALNSDGFNATSAKTPWSQSRSTRASGSPNRRAVPTTDIKAPIASPPSLSSQAEQVSQIAVRNGDRKFLMIDKARGVIILFEDGKPMFSSAALTGAAEGDIIPPGVLSLTASHSLRLEQKVTPAGRFTVRPEWDPEYGRVWTINEIHGRDWDFAIHKVYLGIPSEHRDVRLRSPDERDRHITFGCINVEISTVELFSRELPRKSNTPLYILPQDEGMTASLFQIRGSPSPRDNSDK